MAGLELLTRAAMETATGLFLHGGSRWTVAELLNRLEEEKAKIVVFEREIPLCVSIVSYVVDALKAEDKEDDGMDAAGGNGNGAGRPVLEEFIPIHRQADEEETDADREKRKIMSIWMSSAQLWSGGSSESINSDDDNNNNNNNNNLNRGEACLEKTAKTERFGESQSATEIQDDNKSVKGKVFPIFPANPSSVPAPGAKDEATKVHLPSSPVPQPSPFSGLSLCTPSIMGPVPIRDAVPQQRLTGFADCFNRENVVSPSLNSESDQHHASVRKARRCWSADLHRKFVCALEVLGGPRVATPKQIRELMKVDGLTNDEVKSHLQKYRLHARKQTASSKDLRKPDVGLDMWADAESQNPTANMRSCSSGSPNSHFEFAVSANGRLPSVVADPCDDGKSHSYSWDEYSRRSREIVSG